MASRSSARIAKDRQVRMSAFRRGAPGGRKSPAERGSGKGGGKVREACGTEAGRSRGIEVRLRAGGTTARENGCGFREILNFLVPAEFFRILRFLFAHQPRAAGGDIALIRALRVFSASA